MAGAPSNAPDAPEVPGAPAGAPSRRVKFGYGVADVGASLSYGAVNTWLLFYLVNAVGVPPLAAGGVFLGGRLLDALLDPLMGQLLDGAEGRWSRVQLIRWGALPLGVAFALMWAAPASGAAGAWATLAAFVAYSLLFTVVQVPYLALTPDLAPSYDDRTELTGYRVAFGVLASLLAAALPPLVVTAVAPGPLSESGPGGWRALGALFGLLTALPYVLLTLLVREPRRARRPPRPARSLAREVGAALRLGPFTSLLAVFLTLTVALMVVSSMLPFYLESALQVAAAEQTLVLALFFGTAVVAFPLWTFAAARLGKRAALALALVALAVADGTLVALAPPGGLSAVLLALAALAGVALAGVLMLPWSMLPDVVEVDEWGGGRRREGLLYALFTFGQKAAGSLGVFANAIAAAWFGYRAGAALQAPETVLGIRLMVGPVAAALLLLAALLTLSYPVTRTALDEVQRNLAAPPER